MVLIDVAQRGWDTDGNTLYWPHYDEDEMRHEHGHPAKDRTERANFPGGAIPSKIGTKEGARNKTFIKNRPRPSMHNS